MRIQYLLITLALVLISCKNKEKKNTSSDALKSETAFDFSDGDYFRKGYTKEEERFKLKPIQNSPEFKDASIDGFTWENGKAKFDISNYKLGVQTPGAETKSCANSAKGQHIHFIINKQDYMAEYTPEFEAKISDGQHFILAFLSRSYHESLKHPKASYAKHIEVVDGKIEYEWDLTDPILFYSRPKGTYVGSDTKNVLLDFYPLNVELGKNAWVEVHINGEVKILNKWQPYYIEGLPYGTNSIGIKLIDAEGNQLPYDQTAILKNITIKADPTENL